MSTKTLDMSPKELVNDDGNYILQNQDVYDLLKYVYCGVLLPVTEDAYKARLNISVDVMDKLSGVISPLVKAYASTQDHCQAFKDTTYPTIVSLASDVYHYAQNAGGDAKDSYYGNIFSSIRALADATTQKEQEKLTATINGLVDVQVSAITKLQKRSKQTVADLRTFEGQTRGDQSIMKERSNAVDAKLTEQVGSLDDLENKLQQYRDELKSDQVAYEHDKIVACTTPTYAWLGLIGLITASTIAGIYGKKAVKMANRIDEVNKLIKGYEGKIKDETVVLADLKAIDADLGKVLALIDPTIAVIEKMMGVWSAIADDLNNLREMVNTDVRTANAAISTIVDNKLTKKWDALAKSVDKYRKAAFVKGPEQISLDDLAKQLRKQAAK